MRKKNQFSETGDFLLTIWMKTKQIHLYSRQLFRCAISLDFSSNLKLKFVFVFFLELVKFRQWIMGRKWEMDRAKDARKIHFGKFKTTHGIKLFEHQHLFPHINHTRFFTTTQRTELNGGFKYENFTFLVDCPHLWIVERRKAKL